MKQIILPVHPMSRRILLNESDGQEPIVLRNHDPLFGIFTVRRIRPNRFSPQLTATLSETICIQVDDAIARHCIENMHAIGITLFRIHKDTMCRFIQAATLNGAPALYALREFYFLHRITEDDYQEESAWKSWQRWAKSREKKRGFFAQHRGKPSDVLGKKRASRANLMKRRNPHSWYMKDVCIELAVARFMAAYSDIFMHRPRHLEKHVRIYLYMATMGLTSRETAKKVGAAHNSCSYARRMMEQRMKKNKAIKQLLHNTAALPAPA